MPSTVTPEALPSLSIAAAAIAAADSIPDPSTPEWSAWVHKLEQTVQAGLNAVAAATESSDRENPLWDNHVQHVNSKEWEAQDSNTIKPAMVVAVEPYKGRARVAIQTPYGEQLSHADALAKWNELKGTPDGLAPDAPLNERWGIQRLLTAPVSDPIGLQVLSASKKLVGQIALIYKHIDSFIPKDGSKSLKVRRLDYIAPAPDGAEVIFEADIDADVDHAYGDDGDSGSFDSDAAEKPKPARKAAARKAKPKPAAEAPAAAVAASNGHAPVTNGPTFSKWLTSSGHDVDAARAKAIEMGVSQASPPEHWEALRQAVEASASVGF